MTRSWKRRAALGERARRRTLRCLLAGGLFLPAAGPAQEPPPDDAETPAVVREQITVSDSRLRDRPTDARRVPAHVTVLDRQAIAAAGATTPQELLSREAGVVLFDATGSDLQQTLDLRGFSGGGVKVYLDGAPLNDPRNNALSLELVDPRSLERIEITRGSGSASAGGGSQAGVINLWTRSGDAPGGRLRLGAGSHDRLAASAAGWGRGDGWHGFAGASLDDGDGYRVNGGARLRRLSAAASRSAVGGEMRLSILTGDGWFGNPGALRPDELARDREQAPFNRLDYSDERTTQATLNYDRLFAADLSLRANLFARDREREILTTGRAAPSFGGFFLDTGARLAGSALQITRLGQRHETVAGFDWLDAETAARGVPTPADDPGRLFVGALNSDNLTTRRTSALYLQDRWRPSDRLTATLAGRWDRDRVGYREAFPDPANTARRTYSELSLRGGLTWALDSRTSLYASYGEAFLPPTVEELFSFPLFGSNPGLEPEDSSSLEVGARRSGVRHQTEAVLFRVDTRDEIVFDPDSPLGPFGANVNAAETRRHGLEVAHHAMPRQGVRWFATATWTDAEVAAGGNRGATVPLVPEVRLTAGVDLELASSLWLRGDALRVGEQVLDNDDANLQAPLAAYTVVNARLTWEPRRRSASGGAAAPTLFLTVRNLLGEEYSTRGIFAFDFSTFESSVFLTPAPERRLSVGVEWDF